MAYKTRRKTDLLFCHTGKFRVVVPIGVFHRVEEYLPSFQGVSATLFITKLVKDEQDVDLSRGSVRKCYGLQREKTLQNRRLS
jgi:hypothetical protein